jgi:hypothetical protein
MGATHPNQPDTLWRAHRLLLVALSAVLVLGACAGGSEEAVRSAEAEAPPVTTATAPASSTTAPTVPPSTAPPSTVPATQSRRLTQPTSARATTTTARPATTTTLPAATTTTLPPAFEVPPENLLVTEPAPLPSSVRPGYPWNTGWSGDPVGVEMTPPYQAPTVLAVSAQCRLHQYGLDANLWKVTLSIRLAGGRYWWFPQRPVNADGSDGSAGTGTFVEYLTTPRPPDSPAGTVVDVPITIAHLNSPGGVQFLPMEGVSAHCGA